MGNVQPKFVKDADVGELQAPKRPVLKMCTMQESGFLEIPRDIRDRWLQDPVRSDSTKSRRLSFCVQRSLTITENMKHEASSWLQ